MGNIKLKSKEDDNGKWGYVDEAGNWVIEPKYEEFYIDKNGNRVRDDFAKSIKKLEGQKRAKAKEKRKDLILTEGVDLIIERMRKNNITSIDLQKLDNDWGYGTISPEYGDIYLTLKLNDDGRLYYIAQGYGFDLGKLYLYDKPDDEKIVDSKISDKLLDYLKELAVDSLYIEEEDYIVEYEGEGEADINEIRYYFNQ